MLNFLLHDFSQGELAEEVSPGTNPGAGSTNILVGGTGLKDFGEKIAKIFGGITVNPVTNGCEKKTAGEDSGVLHGCEECEYRSKHVRNLQRHMENMHKSIPGKRKQREGEKKRGQKRAKLGAKGKRERNEGWRVVKRERILELAPISSDYIQSLTLPPLLPQSEKTLLLQQLS